MADEAVSFTSGADQPFFEGLMRGEVCVPACKGCGRWHWPAVFRCSDCGSWDMTWKSVSPKGCIYAWTRTWHKFAGAEAFVPPYVSVVVELSDAPGVRLLGTLAGTDGSFGIGSPVRGRPAAVQSGGVAVPTLSWELEEGAE